MNAAAPATTAWTAPGRVRYAAPLAAVDLIEVAGGPDGLTVIARVIADSRNENLRGHFPGLPIYPGVFVLETLGQAMAAAVGGRPVLRRLISIRFLAAVLGGDELELAMTITEPAAGAWEVRAVGRRRDGVVTTRLHAQFDRGIRK